ncbi:5-(carboxyamino)imidazole ribonucleotide synthase [Thalassoglobus sp.]|uniref:5-(carboxyamino)imidazole ribonucleotide synthase n=1 Tax=Thalassoglobus sp. TaxID=2795869 RepID=UPI003AA7DFEF
MLKQISPGATLGVLGSGQLGRMFAIEARRLGYGVHVFSPDEKTPTGAVADREWTANYDNFDAIDEFARSVDVVTLEFENVPTAALNQIEKFVPVRPGPQVLEAAQNRIKEKSLMRSFGLPTAPFAAIDSLETLTSKLAEFGGKGILKTASWGYDGKGQQMVTSDADLATIWEQYAGNETILEGFIDFSRELSIIGIRDANGNFDCFDPFLNHHANHILDVSLAGPGLFRPKVIERAKEIVRTVMDSLDVVGVLCVELFETSGDDLLVNEIAPRPHNSGHLTIDASYCCQFAQQVRSICNLPLGSTELRQPAAMANLLGDLWPKAGQPDWAAVLSCPEVHLHLYGKSEAKPGRKMGHLTALSNDVSSSEEIARRVRSLL